MATIHGKAGESTPGFEQRRLAEAEAEEEDAEAKVIEQRNTWKMQKRGQREKKRKEAAKLAQQKEWRETKQAQREKKREEQRTALRDAGIDPAQFNTFKELEAAYEDLMEKLKILYRDHELMTGTPRFEFETDFPRLNADALDGRMNTQERRNNRLLGIGEDVANSTLGNEAFAEVSSNVLNYSGESIGDDEEVMDLASIFAEKCTVVESVKPKYKKNSLKYMKKDKLRSILDDMDQGYGKRDTNDALRTQIWEAQREAAKKALSSIFGIKPEEKAKMDALLKKHGYID